MVMCAIINYADDAEKILIRIVYILFHYYHIPFLNARLAIMLQVGIWYTFSVALRDMINLMEYWGMVVNMLNISFF